MAGSAKMPALAGASKIKRNREASGVASILDWRSTREKIATRPLLRVAFLASIVMARVLKGCFGLLNDKNLPCHAHER